METLYVPANEIKAGDILPDVSRFIVASVDVYPSGVHLTFEGTTWEHSSKRGKNDQYNAFKVERQTA